MDLEVEHRRPDPHRREELDERETPVLEEEANPLEEHGEAADHEAKGAKIGGTG